MSKRKRPAKNSDTLVASQDDHLDDVLWGASEIGRYLKVPRSRVYYLIRLQKLPIRRLGRKMILARRADLQRWVDETFADQAA